MAERCVNCSISKKVPSVSFNADNLCSLCQHYQSVDISKEQASMAVALDKAIKDAKIAACDFGSEYDVVVALSGGKDSCFSLIKLSKDYGLRCYCILVDNGFLAPEARQNAEIFCDLTDSPLNVWRIPSKPIFHMYKSSFVERNENSATISRASDTCNKCINIINRIIIKEAIIRNVPLIAGGYIAGQLPKNKPIISKSKAMLTQFQGAKKNNGDYASLYDQTALKRSDVENFMVADTLKVLNPLVSQKYDEALIIDELKTIGWVRPEGTGSHSSNCYLNDLGIKYHFKKYGFHPYELEMAEKVRSGSVSRKAAIVLLTESLENDKIKKLEVKFELNNKL